MSSLATELVPKRIETLRKLVPAVRRIWIIYDAGDPSSVAAARKGRDAGPRLNLQVLDRPVRTTEELELALKQLRPGDAFLPPDIATMDIPAVILEASLAFRIPAVFPAALWVGHGALVSYGPTITHRGFRPRGWWRRSYEGHGPGICPSKGPTGSTSR